MVPKSRSRPYDGTLTSCHGPVDLGVRRIPISHSRCAHTDQAPESPVMENTSIVNDNAPDGSPFGSCHSLSP